MVVSFAFGCFSALGEKAYIANLNAGLTFPSLISAARIVLKTIPVGDAPRSVAATEDGSRVFVLNGRDKTVSIIDPTTDTVINTLDVSYSYDLGHGDTEDFDPAEIVASPNGDTIYLAAPYYGALVVDVATGAITDLGEQLGLNPYELYVNRMFDISPLGDFVYSYQFSGSTAGIIRINAATLQEEGEYSVSSIGFAVADDGASVFTRYIGELATVHTVSFLVDPIDLSDSSVYMDFIDDLDFAEPLVVAPDNKTVYYVVEDFTSYNDSIPFSSDTPAVVAIDSSAWKVLGVVPIEDKPSRN